MTAAQKALLVAVDEVDPRAPVVIQLKYPLELLDGEPIRQLKMRPMTGRDLQRCTVSAERQIAMLMEIAGFLCGQPPVIMGKLIDEDLGEVIEQAGVFFQRIHVTGKTSSDF